MLGLLLSISLAADPQPNLDFEAGTLAGWTATGEAFKDQPIKGDTVAVRRGDMKSNHQGEYWIGGYEKHGDKPKGTLTSDVIKVTQPWASFLVGGGSGPNTRVEILNDGKVVFKAHGTDHEEMRRVSVDISKYQTIQIRLVDNSSTGWGHVNFDDFRFHAEQPAAAKTPQGQLHSGLTPEKAAAAMTVPEGFHVTLFAGEPDVHQPVAFCFDDRGRLWVVEAFQYPTRHPHPGPVIPDKSKGDKILIFEDVDGDGKFDKRTVFMEGLNLVSGIEYGFGGIYVGAAPYLLHIPVKDDKPAGEPVILLDGFDYADTHETLNTFIWGPDGWLYGCHGVFNHSKVGKPGAKDNERTKINAGYWRWHPTRKVFELFAEGTSNPWGLDYNQHGDFFASCCVIPHLFHIVQGGRYTRQAGNHFNPHTYIEIPTIADHRHYVGNQWNNNDRAKSDDFGGGHAHCGLMCYQGGAWPKEYHGQLFMGNIHGKRINMDIPKSKGSTYSASHGKDFLLANDEWARFIAMKYGPDGNMYVIDWYDKQACHLKQPEIWDRTNGRIYKVSYRGTKPVANLDLAKCSDEELIKYQSHENEWYVQRARRILQERYSKGRNSTQLLAARRDEKNEFETQPIRLIRKQLAQLAYESKNELHRLRGLWLLHSMELFDVSTGNDHEPKPDPKNKGKYLDDPSPHVRGWMFQFHATDNAAAASFDPGFEGWFEITVWNMKQEKSPIALGRMLSQVTALSPDSTTPIVYGLAQACNGINDPLIRNLLWYINERQLTAKHQYAIKTAVDSGDPELIRLLSRRSSHSDSIDELNYLFKEIPTTHHLSLLEGLRDGIAGRKVGPLSAAWKTLLHERMKSADPKISEAALSLAVAMRDGDAMNTFRERLVDAKRAGSERLQYFQSLLEAHDDKMTATFNSLLLDPALRAPVIKAMASVGASNSSETLLTHYSKFSPTEKRDAVATMASKPAFAIALLNAIEAKTIPAADVPAEAIRQLRSFKDKALDAKIAAVWGTFRNTPAERKKFIAQWRSKLINGYTPDLAHGRAVFAKACAQCHTLYGTGGNVGPEITGANRADLNYLLENIFDPSAVIQKEYAATTFDLADGRKLTGIVKTDGPQITLQTATETVKFAATDVEKRTASELSMMPDDLTKPLTEGEVLNLIAYLRYPQQVPMKATADNAKEFFNGKDLTGWDGDKEVWSVVDGAIVGKTETGLKKNTFLTSQLEVSDFKLSLKAKLTPNKGNSGIQFRSVRIDGGEMKGAQADMGAGWWGKLYEESARGLLVKNDNEKLVKVDDWNDYVIEAKGSTVKMWLNGTEVVNLTDDKLAKKGLIGVQVHSGGPMEVRFKDLKLEVLEGK